MHKRCALAALLSLSVLLIPLPSADALVGTATRYEPEVATYSTGSSVDTNHSGFSGTGFVNTRNAVNRRLDGLEDARDHRESQRPFEHRPRHSTHHRRHREPSTPTLAPPMVSRAVQRGYVDPSYKATADRGYRGVLASAPSSS